MSDTFTTMSEAIEAYDDMLNEVYGVLSVGGLEYDHAEAFKTLDPIAYRVGFDDYMDSLEVDTDELEDDADL